MGDALHVQVLVSGAPQGGAFTVWAARLPETLPADRRACAVAPVSGSPGWWEVTLPTPGLWYLYLQDGQGWSDLHPVWTVIEEVNHIGEWLRDILRRHKKGIEAAIAPHFNAMHPLKQQATNAPTRKDPTISQIIYGLESLVEAWPSIVIVGQELEEPYFATGYCRLVTYRFEITFMHWHQDRLTSMLKMATAAGRSIQYILNLPEYANGQLPSGAPFTFASADRLTWHEGEADPGWGAEATLTWTCQRVRHQIPGSDLRP